MSGEIWRWTAVETAAAIRKRQISAREAVSSHLSRLEVTNPLLNAVTDPLAEAAQEAAEAADAAVARGDALGPLHGVPVTVKENVDCTGRPTTNGVVAFQSVIAAGDAPPVANWRKAGAICIGRTNTPDFSVRWHTDNDLRGRTLNPWSGEHTPGGSSGGAAASVAAGIGALAHGNDYGGSLRYPAMCCGVATIRPSFGRVPAYNPTSTGERPPTAQLMSVQGPIARTVADVRLGLEAIAAADPRDPWWSPVPLVLPKPAAPIKVALSIDPGGQGTHPAVADGLRQAAKALEGAGYRVEEREPPLAAEAAELWKLVVLNEMRALMLPDIRRLGSEGIKRSVELMIGDTPELDAAGYMKALGERTRMWRAWNLFLQDWPLVLCPVSTRPPFAVGDDIRDQASADAVVASQCMLIGINVMGLPGAAVPVGVKDGLPQSVQIVGARFREDLCLDAAQAIEDALGTLTPIDPR